MDICSAATTVIGKPQQSLGQTSLSLGWILETILVFGASEIVVQHFAINPEKRRPISLWCLVWSPSTISRFPIRWYICHEYVWRSSWERQTSLKNISFFELRWDSNIPNCSFSWDIVFTTFQSICFNTENSRRDYIGRGSVRWVNSYVFYLRLITTKCPSRVIDYDPFNNQYLRVIINACVNDNFLPLSSANSRPISPVELIKL